MDADKLNALGSVTADADGEAGPTPEQAEAVQKEIDADVQAREWGVIPYTIGQALAMFVPELKHVYTEDRCLAWGRSVVPVAEKYGVKSGGIPELGLVLSTVGLVLPTIFLIRKRLTEPAAEGEAGTWAAVKAWWRDKRARAAARVGQHVADTPQQAPA